MEPYYETNETQRIPHDWSATLSLFVSIMSVFGSLTVFMGVIGGIIAISCGIISRVRTGKFCLNTILGITIGGIAIALSCVVFLGMIILLQDPETLAEISKLYQQMY